MEVWKTYKLGQVTQWRSGGTPRKSVKEYWGGDIPWISAKTLNERYVYDSPLKVTDVGLKNGTKLALKGSILLLVRGSGLFNDIPVAMASQNVAFNQDVKCIIPSIKELSNYFLLYWFKGNKRTFTNMLEATSIGAGKFDMARLFELPFHLPPLPEQKAIASILSAIDDKIELNLQMNKTLEGMAMALYKHWFVDFDFPCLPSDYRPTGQVNRNEVSRVCTYKRVGGLPVPDGKSWFVYVLECSSSSIGTQIDETSLYKGITNDLYRRFYEHYTGIGAKWTKLNKPIRVIHWERFDTQEEAAKREKELKTGYGRTWLQRQLAKITNGSPAQKMMAGLPAQKMMAGSPAQKMMAGPPALKTQLRMAGKFVDSELGMIPEGWEVKRLGDVSTMFAGGDKPKVFSKEENENLNIPIYSNGISNEGLYGYTDKARIFEESVTVSARGTIGFVCLRMKPYLPIVRLVSVIPNKEYISSKYLFHCLKNLNIQGNGTTQQQLTVPDFKETKIIIPHTELVNEFTKNMDITYNNIVSNKVENQTLNNLRDTLLPKLISGDVRLKDFQKSIE